MDDDPEPPVDDHDLRAQARQRLRQHGPATPAELLRAFDAEDDLDEQELTRLLMDETSEDGWVAFPLLDGRLCDRGALLDGLVLTHVLAEHERETGTVDNRPDLDVLVFLADDDLISLAGADAGRLTLRPDGLVGPPGWLPDENVLVLRVADGHVEIGGTDEVPATDDLTAERLAQTLEALRERHTHPIDEAELLMEARARYPQLLTDPQAPLEVLLASQDLVAAPGGVLPVDEAEEPSSTDQLADHLRDDHGLDEEQVDAVLYLLLEAMRIQNKALRAGLDDAHRRIEQGQEVDDSPVTSVEQDAADAAAHDIDQHRTASALELALADDDAVLAIIDDVIEDDWLAASAVLDLLDAAPPTTRDRGVRANAAWVRARALELTCDDHTDAERELRRARELDPDHAPAGFDLASYLSLRGQAGAALGVLRHIEGPGVEELVDLLSGYAQPGPMSAGRNDPCPCGSGRKHKVCCAVHGGWSLTDRMPWVLHKVQAFHTSAYARDVVTDVVLACGASTSEERDVAVLNLTLFEGGVIEDLCEVRGALLPADELALLRAWSQVRGGLYELIERPGNDTGVLLDLRTGERTGIVDRSLTSRLEVGAAMLAWLVPDPDGTIGPFFGVLQIPDPHRTDLLELLDEEPEATELARWVRELYAPPSLATTGGDPMVSVEQTYEVVDADAARTALAEHLEEDEDGVLRAFEERDGNQWVKGSIRLTDDRLTVETMSAPRAAWFAELIAEVVPDARLVDEQHLPAADLLAGDRSSNDTDLDEGGGLDLDALSAADRAEVEEQLEGFMRQHEDSWVDSPLPMLDGATPRQALEDPTRRETVLRLLDEIQRDEEAWDGPGRGMSASLLRELLELT